MKFKSTNFREARELYRRYNGKPLWIAGSDPSLSGYPDSFFDDKTAITLHLAHMKFPNATMRYSSEFDRSEYLLSKDKAYARLPLIAALPMYGKTEKETMELLENNEEVYFHRMVSYPPFGVRGRIDEDFTRFKIAQTLKNRATIWGGHGSCLHTCLYMAILMGASEIHLIGAGHNLYTEGDLEHFAAVEGDHHAMRPGYRSFADPVENSALIEQTWLTARLCREAGIPFYWHRRYTEALDELIEIDGEWFADLKKRGTRKFPLKKEIYWKLVKGPITSFISKR